MFSHLPLESFHSKNIFCGYNIPGTDLDTRDKWTKETNTGGRTAFPSSYMTRDMEKVGPDDFYVFLYKEITKNEALFPQGRDFFILFLEQYGWQISSS